jgi:hypothetical protein
MPQKIVRPLDTPRLMAAERGVSAAMGNVLNRVGETWNTRVLARLYASAALAADDRHGREHKLITQHHGIAEPDLLDVIALAVPPARHGVTGEVHPGCPDCRRVFALGRVRNAVLWTGAPDQD